MPFPAKFRYLMETAELDAVVPDIVWLSFALCCVEQDSCGWTGWIIESAWRGEASAEFGERHFVPAADNQRCPNCGKQTYRTGLEKQFEISSIQPPKIEYDYESTPLEFDDD